MSSAMPVTRSPSPSLSIRLKNPNFQSRHLLRLPAAAAARRLPARYSAAVFASGKTAEVPKKKRDTKGFVGEMRLVAMRLHTRDQSKEGEKEPQAPPVAKWQPSVEGYLRFLVDSKLVYDTLESIVEKAACPWCELLRYPDAI